jgi:uncharacterized protein DUF4190
MTDYAAQPAPQPAARPGAGMAITALIMGILALLLFWTVVGGILFGIIALILGPIASGRAKRGVSSGRGMAITGAVLGLIGLIASVALVAVGVSIFNSSGAKTFTQCVDDANGDQTKLHKCEDKFRHKIENNN